MADDDGHDHDADGTTVVVRTPSLELKGARRVRH